jgi:predicted outer membrane protein
MLRRTLLLIAGATPGLACGRDAAAQANIVPDHTPRLPPQPGQGLPLEDRRFLRDAAALSAAQVEAATQMAGQSSDDETRQLAAALAERHGHLSRRLRELTQQSGLQPGQPIPEAAAPSNPQVADAIRRLAELSNASPRDFLAAQIAVHPVLVEMYQTQASQTADRELGRFAIITLTGIQEDFAAVVRLGERHGLPRPERLLSNPPQYGPGAGPPR